MRPIHPFNPTPADRLEVLYRAYMHLVNADKDGTFCDTDAARDMWEEIEALNLDLCGGDPTQTSDRLVTVIADMLGIDPAKLLDDAKANEARVLDADTLEG